jgi:hypothetical protein
MSEIRAMTVKELAEDAFLKTERVKALSAMNQPLDFHERKKEFIEYQEAQADANEAARALAKAVA